MTDTKGSISHALLGIVLLLAAVQGPSCSASEPRAQVAFNPYSYIPRGSKIPDPARDVVFADVEGDDTDEVVIFYLVPDGKFVKPSIMALRKRDKVGRTSGALRMRLDGSSSNLRVSTTCSRPAAPKLSPTSV